MKNEDGNVKNSLSDSRILIVDDDRAIREPMCEFLEMYNFKTSMAENAEKAITFLKSNAVDIVITDIMMPGMNGLELTDFIKNNYNSDVIVMTGYSDNYSYEEAVSKGASDFIFKPVRFTELILRIKRVLRERRLAHERDLMVNKLKKLAVTDGLTGLFNLRHFYDQLSIEIDRFNRYHHPLSLLMMDIDHFKHFNDTYGHLEGDKVLIKVAQIIIDSLRKLDTAFRYGGEEFTIILPETCLEKAMVAARRIQKDLSQANFRPQKSDTTVKITVSIGVTEYSPQETMADFIKRADQAMYLSKQNGRNRISKLRATPAPN
jgi:diguanylate cyclase (GGDEF)-like protein